ncbi:MAG: hypothetical protein J1E16_02785 [Muribaculaceae bacterium]|nr:hypothetical protein [Muribaculaceae bacterium]
MKKVFVSMMLAGALLISGTAYAQTQADGTTGASVQKENTDKGKKKDKKGDKKGSKGMRTEKEPKFNPFDGVQLTPDQQQRLQVLQQGLGPVELSKKQMENIPENPNLTAEQKKQLAKERKAKKLEAKKNYLNGVKEILTPDQYVIFLENVYLYSPQDKGKSGKHGDKKKGKSADRADKMKKDKSTKKK